MASAQGVYLRNFSEIDADITASQSCALGLLPQTPKFQAFFLVFFEVLAYFSKH